MTSGKKILLIAVIVIVVLAVSVFSFFKGSYNQFVTLDEGVKSAWAQV
jgi:LemA protein